MSAFDAEDWRPDELLVPALLAGSPTTMDTLSKPDRAWAVAVMKLAGMTAEQIGDRLDCSVRLVRAVWSEAGVIAALVLNTRETFGEEHRMLTGEVTRLDRERRDAVAAARRYRQQLDNVLDAHLTGEVETFPCGCPRTRYNTYVAPKTGKAGCREHRRQAVARHRERKRQTAPAEAEAVVVSGG